MDESPKYLVYRSYFITLLVVVVCSCFLFISRDYRQLPSSLQANTLGGPSESLPNFVFILADDLGWSDIGSSNSSFGFVMPTLMELAEGGIRLTSYYSQESCTPARASLLTGRYPLTVGMQFGDVDTEQNWGLNLTEILLPTVLKDEGNYGTYILGKWNLGHFSAEFLPTARGFDYFLGYLSGQVYYWSKRVPQYPRFIDFMYANTDCYDAYNGSDMHDYSTFFYSEKAVSVIESHDYTAQPLFLYFSSQAVHDPFNDYHMYSSGIPPDYLDTSLYDTIMSTVVGRKRRQYAMALALLDGAVLDMYKALETVGQLSNTYIIFASDNGGCYEAGGYNGALRGSKGSLYEGGTKVDAFIYSPLIKSSLVGTTYDGIMHVSDWFPTVLSLANIDYDSPVTLDGVDQSDAIMGGGSDDNLRSTLLYNFYIDVEREDFSLDSAPVGIRNAQYKLLHAYEGNDASLWYSFDEAVEDDDVLLSGTCGQTDSLTGTYTYYLFDLLADPYETTNLYGNDSYASVKYDLYAELSTLRAAAREEIYTSASKLSAQTWKDGNHYVGPWTLTNSDSAPRQCGFSGTVVSPYFDDDDSSSEEWQDGYDQEYDLDEIFE